MKLTGHERDVESASFGNPDGLDYMLARYYSSSLARFMAVDPAADSSSLGDPQSWNRYAYAANNPLKFVDPDGRDEFLFTWAPTADRVGHSAIGTTVRQENGCSTGQVRVRDLMPTGEPSVDSLGKSGAGYRSQVIDEAGVGSFQGIGGDQGRPADGIVKIAGGADQDSAVNGALDSAAKNSQWGPNNNCASFTKAGVEAAGVSGGTGGAVSYDTGAGVVSETLDTPVSVHNGAAGSGNAKVNVQRPLPKDKQNPDVKVN